MKYYIYQGVGESGGLTKTAEVTDQKTHTVTGLHVQVSSRARRIAENPHGYGSASENDLSFRRK